MKYCQNCRESFDANNNLCPKCGKQLEATTKQSSGDYNIKNPFLDLKSTKNSGSQDSNGLVTNKFGTYNNLSNVETSSYIHDTQPPLIKEEQIVSSHDGLNDGLLLFSNNEQKNSITEEEAKENLERLKKLNNPVLDFDPQKIQEQKEKRKKELDKKIKSEEKKETRFISYTYIIMAAIMIFLTIIPLLYNIQIEALVHHLIIIVLLVVSYKLLPFNKKISYLIGFLSSVAMILTVIEKDYVTLALGVLLLIAVIFSLLVKK